MSILFSKLQVYNTLLLTIVTMLYIKSPELIHLITESLHYLINIFLTPVSGNYHLISVTMSSTDCFYFF